jgi:hypothetical protein
MTVLARDSSNLTAPPAGVAQWPVIKEKNMGHCSPGGPKLRMTVLAKVSRNKRTNKQTNQKSTSRCLPLSHLRMETDPVSETLCSLEYPVTLNATFYKLKIIITTSTLA